jgi:argininosuccinate lyase
MSQPFGFIRLGDQFCTGSSMMPQKKNPDVPELVRGKTGRVNGHLVALLTLMKAQPLAYNKDNQEDKEPLFDTVDTLTDTLIIYAEMLASLEVDAAKMRAQAQKGYATATDLADYLVKRGVPFRDAHEVVARAVRHAEGQKKDLAQLGLEELQEFSKAIGADVFQVLSVEGSVKARAHAGGTAPEQVVAAIKAARVRIAEA